MDASKTVTVTISGRVQGVSYRAWTRDTARGLGLSGFVRNRDDGTVEAVFGGPGVAVDRMVALCRDGPPGAKVTDVAVSDVAVTSVAEGGATPENPVFSIRQN